MLFVGADVAGLIGVNNEGEFPFNKGNLIKEF